MDEPGAGPPVFVNKPPVSAWAYTFFLSSGDDVRAERAPIDTRPRPRRTDQLTRQPQPPTRRHRVTAIMTADPSRSWTGRELATRLGVEPRNMLTQLAEWTRLGFLTRTSAGSYTLATPT